jgi:hypothetical protein
VRWDNLENPNDEIRVRQAHALSDQRESKGMTCREPQGRATNQIRMTE